MKNEADIVQFALRLRELREAKGMSQQELADTADIDKKTIQRIEMNRMNPSLDVLISLAKALGVKVGELIGF